MAKKSNPKIIGGFVVGAILLTIVGVMAFGGGEFLKHKIKAVMFFQGSLAGLDVGAPITFRGVKIGTVTAIAVQYDIAKQVLNIPVYIEIQPDSFQVVNGERNPVRNLNALIARGLRGQLQTVSMVTGQTVINFDFHPGTPIRLLNIVPGVAELPSIPSGMDVMMSSVSSVLTKIGNLPLEQISSQLLDTMKSADQALKDADSAMTGANGLVANLNAQVKPLTDGVMKISSEASLTLQEARDRLQLREGEPLQTLNGTLLDGRRLIDNLNNSLPVLIATAEQVMKTITTALDQASTTLRSAQSAISPDSPLYYELNSTLRELKTAATAIRVFAEYIQRNPSALLTGNR
jgi:paraquat-inducible protein B